MRKKKMEFLPTPYLEGTAQVQILRSARRTISVEINRKGEVVVRTPSFLPAEEIGRFLYSRKEWIDSHLKAYRKKIESDAVSCKTDQSTKEWTEKELSAIRKQAAADLKSRVDSWAQVLEVTYGTVSIRTQRTRWGSCSSKGNISLNALLILLDEDLRDYTVVHELCHRKYMDHSGRFWAEVGKVLPNYRELRKRLKEEGTALIARLP